MIKGSKKSLRFRFNFKKLVLKFLIFLLIFGDVFGIIKVPTMVQAATLTYVGGAEAFGNSASFNVSLTSLTGGIDTAARTNDLVIVSTGFVQTSNLDPGVSTEGYIEEADLYQNDTRDANFSVNWKIMGSTPDASVACNGSSSTTNGAVAVVHVWRNADTATPLDVTTTTLTGNNASNPNSPAITPVTPGAVIISTGLGTMAAVDNAVTAPANFINKVDISVDPGNAATIGISSYAGWSSDAYDPAAWTGFTTTTSDSWAAATLAIRPSPSAGVSAAVNKATESWFGETQIYGTPTGGLNPANYQARAKITTPANGTDYPSAVVYKDMTWNAGNSRWEATYKLDSDGYGAGLADPRTGAFTVQIQLDAEAPYFEFDGDAEYTSDTSFTSIVVRRRPSVNAASPQNYTDFIPIWSTDHWNYSINEFAIEATTANTNTIIKYPVYPTTANISNVSVTGTTAGLADGYASYWDAGSHSIVFKVDVINGQRLINVTFDSDTDLFGTRIDRYQTKDIGIRDFYNGLEISNSKLTAPIFGGGHEGAGEAVDLHAKDATTESTLDCMERTALYINDTVNIDSSAYYSANIKWKQTGWQNWITYQDNNKIIVENEEDDTATTGWKQKLDYGIDAHRKITFLAGENYDKHEYDFTNNGASSKKLSFVWGREQWLEGPGSGTREINDKGVVPDNATDYNQVYPFAGSGTDPNTSLTKPWFTTYDTGSNYFMGVIFQNDFRPDNVYFDTGIALATYTNYMPIFNTGAFANYPIPRPGDLAQASAESHWFEKSWNPVGIGENRKFTFLRTGGYDASRANIVSLYENKSLPSFAVTPDNAGSGAANTTVTYTNNIQNNSSSSDTINLSTSSSQSWTAQTWNEAENSQITSVTLNSGANINVKVKVIIPPGALQDTVDITKLIGESSYNGLTESATNTTTVNNTAATLTMQEVYSPAGSIYDTTEPFEMFYGDVVPGQSYIIGEGPQSYAIKMQVSVSGANYKLQGKGQTNFTSGLESIPISRLAFAKDLLPNTSAHSEGDWTTFSLSDQDIYSNESPGTNTYYFDYRLLPLFSDNPADGFSANIIYTLTTL